MNIMQICSAETIGGGEIHVADLAKALLERGHRVQIAIRRQSQLPLLLEHQQIIWHQMPLRNALDFPSILELRRVIGQEKINVVHAHVGRDYIVAGLATKNIDTRFFLTRHHFNPFRSNAFYRWSLNHTAGLIGVSDYISKNLREAFPALVPRIVTIPNWIDTSIRFLSKEEAREELSITRPVSIGVIGQLAPIKGQEILIRSVKNILQNKKFEHQLELSIIGQAAPIDLDYEKKIRSLAAYNSDPQAIKFWGFIDQIKTKLKAFDIVVIPSMNEGFSLVLIEAMIAGCAVIATKTGGMSEIIDQQKTGILVEAGKIEALQEAIEILVNDQGLRSKLGVNARNAVREKFDRKIIIDRIENLYSEK